MNEEASMELTDFNAPSPAESGAATGGDQPVVSKPEKKRVFNFDFVSITTPVDSPSRKEYCSPELLDEGDGDRTSHLGYVFGEVPSKERERIVGAAEVV